MILNLDGAMPKNETLAGVNSSELCIWRDNWSLSDILKYRINFRALTGLPHYWKAGFYESS